MMDGYDDIKVMRHCSTRGAWTLGRLVILACNDL